MKLTDFSTLAEAQAFTEQTTRMISNSTMRLYLKATSLFLVIYELAEGKLDTDNGDGTVTNHGAKELCLLIIKSLEGSSTDDNDFNFIIGNSIGDSIIADTENLRDVLLVSHAPCVQALLDVCIAHCNVTTTPFVNTTQEEFDVAHTELLSSGSSEAVMSYDQVDSNQLFHVRSNTNKTKIEIALDTVAAYDTKFKVYVSEPSGITGDYVERTGVIANELIKSDKQETVLLLEQNYGRHTKYRIVSDRVGACTALVTSVSKH